MHSAKSTRVQLLSSSSLASANELAPLSALLYLARSLPLFLTFSLVSLATRSISIHSIALSLSLPIDLLFSTRASILENHLREPTHCHQLSLPLLPVTSSSLAFSSTSHNKPHEQYFLANVFLHSFSPSLLFFSSLSLAYESTAVHDTLFSRLCSLCVFCVSFYQLFLQLSSLAR